MLIPELGGNQRPGRFPIHSVNVDAYRNVKQWMYRGKSELADKLVHNIDHREFEERSLLILSSAPRVGESTSSSGADPTISGEGRS